MPARDPSGTRTYAKLSDYYADQAIFPTYSRFHSVEGLNAHEVERRRVFTEKLYLPPRAFKGARLIEFGPDTGENALVFARWGAQCTLVEPNANAHQTIRGYFDRFGLCSHLDAIVPTDLEGFVARPEAALRYDMIVAEGFIYTVKPESTWIQLFSRLLSDDGYAVFSFYDPTSCFMELMLKVIHANACRWSGHSRADTARLLFTAKWDGIGHRRSIDSWIMDVLENPFVRLEFFIDSRALCRAMHDAGVTLYSAWPPYADGLDIHWFKKTHSPGERLASQERFITRSLLGHLFGRPIFLVEERRDVDALLAELLGITDRLIDAFDHAQAARCAELLAQLEPILRSGDIVASDDHRQQALELTQSYRSILDLLQRQDFEALARFCSTDRRFVQDWGVPNHYAAFTRSGPTPG
jgi:hypothetical protein